jgi:hypothetical protein
MTIIRTANWSGKFARYRVPNAWKRRRNLKQTNDSCKTRTYILMVFCFSFEVAEACIMYKLNHRRKQEIGNLPTQTDFVTTPEQHFMYDSLTMYKLQLKIYRQQTAFLSTVTPNLLKRKVSHFTYTRQKHKQASHKMSWNTSYIPSDRLLRTARTSRQWRSYWSSQDPVRMCCQPLPLSSIQIVKIHRVKRLALISQFYVPRPDVMLQ